METETLRTLAELEAYTLGVKHLMAAGAGWLMGLTIWLAALTYATRRKD